MSRRTASKRILILFVVVPATLVVQTRYQRLDSFAFIANTGSEEQTKTPNV